MNSNSCPLTDTTVAAMEVINDTYTNNLSANIKQNYAVLNEIKGKLQLIIDELQFEKDVFLASEKAVKLDESRVTRKRSSSTLELFVPSLLQILKSLFESKPVNAEAWKRKVTIARDHLLRNFLTEDIKSLEDLARLCMVNPAATSVDVEAFKIQISYGREIEGCVTMPYKMIRLLLCRDWKEYTSVIRDIKASYLRQKINTLPVTYDVIAGVVTTELICSNTEILPIVADQA